MKELTKNIDNIDDTTKNKEREVKLNEEEKKYGPLFDKASEISWELWYAAQKIFQPRIDEAWKKEKSHGNFNKFNKVFQLQTKLLEIEKQAKGFKDAVNELKNLLIYERCDLDEDRN